MIFARSAFSVRVTLLELLYNCRRSSNFTTMSRSAYIGEHYNCFCRYVLHPPPTRQRGHWHSESPGSIGNIHPFPNDRTRDSVPCERRCQQDKLRAILIFTVPLPPSISTSPISHPTSIGWGDDPRGGRVGLDARRYQAAVNLTHRQAMFRLIYAALRNGTMLCNGDLSFALSGCGESPREVRDRQNRRGSCVLSVYSTQHITVIPSKLAPPFGPHPGAICVRLDFCFGTPFPLKRTEV